MSVLVVDDGSTDDTPVILESLRTTCSWLSYLRLSRNFGHQAAVSAGLDFAEADCVVIMDADLQDPPEVIPSLIAAWQDGAEIVEGRRASRAGESHIKRGTAAVFYRLLRGISDTPMSVDVGDFRLLDRSVVETLRSMREESRYLRGMVRWTGFRYVQVDYDRAPRVAGRTHYPLHRMVGLAIDAVTAFTERPLRVASYLGFVATLVSAGWLAYLIVSKILDPGGSLPGFATLLGAVLFFGGVQLMSIGILGEYVGRIYRESKRRPLYVIDEKRSQR